MSRPLRLEFTGALYHVTSRGNGRADIYFGDADRRAWLGVLEQTCQRFNWRVHAWCEMSNHYHLLLETPEGNLSEGMRHLNGVYTQHVNRVHRRVGHVFQGRYKAVLVERESRTEPVPGLVYCFYLKREAAQPPQTAAKGWG